MTKAETLKKVITLSNIDLKEFSPKLNEIKSITSKIPSDGHYDTGVISVRIGEYIHGIMQCGDVLAQLRILEGYKEIELKKEEAEAALVRAPEKGYKTSADKKLYSQMDESCVKISNELEEVRGLIQYIDNFMSSLDKAHLHCKKILDGMIKEGSFAGQHEKFSNTQDNWITKQK